MSPKINELLAVLMMPEKKQPEWFWENGYLKKYIHKVDFISQNFATYSWKLSLADLAFRLRSEVQGLKSGVKLWEWEVPAWYWAKAIVHKTQEMSAEEATCFEKSTDEYFADKATASEVIFAALIAKELANNEQTD